MRSLLSTGLRVLGGSLISLVLMIVSTTAAHAQTRTYFFHTDHLGTPQAVTDTDQAVVWQAEYSPFGEAAETVSLVEQNLRFPGQYFDVETELHYNYFRDYDPSIGRYVESDPIGLAGGIDTFGYAYQNPLRYYDPSGLIVPVWAVSVGISVAAWVLMDIVLPSMQPPPPADSGLAVPAGFPIDLGVATGLRGIASAAKARFCPTPVSYTHLTLPTILRV